jgi:hypothetical protein
MARISHGSTPQPASQFGIEEPRWAELALKKKAEPKNLTRLSNLSQSFNSADR